MPTGVVVAGGRSTRFGAADKTLAPLAGRPMIRHVADRLVASAAIDTLVVNCRPDQRSDVEDALAGLAPTFAEDPETDEGPLAGIRTALRVVRSEYAFVAAADMPFLDPSLVSFLCRRAEGHDAAVPRLDEWFQPTHAAYRVDPMLAASEGALARGERKPIAPLDELDAVIVPGDVLREAGDLTSFENVNTREEFEAAADRLG